MGLPMALNLHKKLQLHGSSLTFSNRTLSKGAALSDGGAVEKNSIVEVAESCDDVFTMVRYHLSDSLSYFHYTRPLSEPMKHPTDSSDVPCRCLQTRC